MMCLLLLMQRRIATQFEGQFTLASAFDSVYNVYLDLLNIFFNTYLCCSKLMS